MRLATWNINGLRARLDFILHWLDSRRPDLIALQELKMVDGEFPHSSFEEAGYEALTHGQKSWNGVALLRRLDGPAPSGEPTQVGLPNQDDFGARLLTARFGDLSMASLYCPNGKRLGHPDFPRKLAWFDDLLAHLQESHDPNEPLVLAGDFNLCPTGKDSWNEARLQGSIFHTEEERQRFRDLGRWGLDDLWRRRHPEPDPDTVRFSWWDYRGGSFHRNHGLRIDFLLGTAPVAEALEDAWIDRDYRKKKDGMTASDHAPVIVDVDL